MVQRKVLAVVGLATLFLLAGCSAAGSLDMRVATDDRVTQEASRTVPETDDEPVKNGAVIEAAIENGSTTARNQEPLVDSGLPFRHQGQYYNVSSSVVDRQPGASYRLGIDYNGTATDSATVSYENLSARDREILSKVLPPIPVTKDPGPEYYIDGIYTTAERNRSVLVAEGTEAVRYEGETYPVEITDTDSTTVITHEYTATLVAESTEAYAHHLRSEYAFRLSGLSDAERSVVTAAINDTYYAESDSDEPFEAVLSRFDQQNAIERNEFRGVWIVRYDGEIYVAQLSYEGFDVE